MSRVGRLPVTVPAGVEVNVKDHLVTVSRPKGELINKIHPDMQVSVEDGQVFVTRPSDDKQHRASTV